MQHHLIGMIFLKVVFMAQGKRDRLSAEQRHDIVERIESRSGLHQLEYMKTLHMGNDRYELIKL